METKEPKKQEETLKTTNVNVKYAIRAEKNMLCVCCAAKTLDSMLFNLIKQAKS